jgi:hypothetical protein
VPAAWAFLDPLPFDHNARVATIRGAHKVPGSDLKAELARLVVFLAAMRNLLRATRSVPKVFIPDLLISTRYCPAHICFSASAGRSLLPLLLPREYAVQLFLVRDHSTLGDDSAVGDLELRHAVLIH